MYGVVVPILSMYVYMCVQSMYSVDSYYLFPPTYCAGYTLYILYTVVAGRLDTYSSYRGKSLRVEPNLMK